MIRRDVRLHRARCRPTRSNCSGSRAPSAQRLGRMIQFAEPDTWENPERRRPAGGTATWWPTSARTTPPSRSCSRASRPRRSTTYRATLGEGAELDIDGFNAWSVGATVRPRRARGHRHLGHGPPTPRIAYAAAARRPAPGATTVTRGSRARSRPRFLVQSQVVEWFLHGEDMRATNGVRDGWQQRWQHWPVHLTIDMAVRMLPWQLARRGIDLPGASLLIEAEGAGEGRWHWGLSPDEVPAPRARAPTVVIKAQAPQLALVVGPAARRRPGARRRHRGAGRRRRARPTPCCGPRQAYV